jgi:hypothetical protein
MVLATLLLICSVPQLDDAAKAVADSNAAAVLPNHPAVSSDGASKDAPGAAALPSAPEPKVKPDVEPAAQPFQPVRPAVMRPRETPRQRKMWYGLMVAGHGGAAFDAWTTRRAISGGYGQEANPFLRPFANSNAIYAVTQVSPAFMDYLGKRMMVSQNPWIRKLWWVPQVAGTGMSFAAGAHNMSVVH